MHGKLFGVGSRTSVLVEESRLPPLHVEFPQRTRLGKRESLCVPSSKRCPKHAQRRLQSAPPTGQFWLLPESLTYCGIANLHHCFWRIGRACACSGRIWERTAPRRARGETKEGRPLPSVRTTSSFPVRERRRRLRPPVETFPPRRPRRSRGPDATC